MSTSSRLNKASTQLEDSKRFDASSQDDWSTSASELQPQETSNSIFPPFKADADGGFAQTGAESNIPHEAEAPSRAPLTQHDMLLLSSLPAEESLARRAASGLDPRIATTTDELCAHLETERFKLVVVECAKGATDMVRLALETHRQLPSDDKTALIAFTPTPEGGLDLLRYTPYATAFAFLAAQEHQLRAHFLKLING